MYGKFLATISKVAKLQTFLLTKNRSRVRFQICPNSKTSGKLIKAAKPRFRSNPTLGQAIPAPDLGHCSTGARGAWAPGPGPSPARPGLSKPSARPDSDVPGLGQRYPVFDRARLPCRVRATHNFVQPPKKSLADAANGGLVSCLFHDVGYLRFELFGVSPFNNTMAL